jgi:hypothetical protein
VNGGNSPSTAVVGDRICLIAVLGHRYSDLLRQQEVFFPAVVPAVPAVIPAVQVRQLPA